VLIGKTAHLLKECRKELNITCFFGQENPVMAEEPREGKKQQTL
jgi:hypothetical protein